MHCTDILLAINNFFFKKVNQTKKNVNFFPTAKNRYYLKKATFKRMRKTLGSSILLLDLAVCYQCAQVHQTQLEHYTSSKRTKYHFHFPSQ